MTAIDRPWRRDGAARYARERLRRILRPPVEVGPVPADVRKDRDAEIVVRDGTILRANVYRPADGAPMPAIVFAHPYGKDKLPRPKRGGRFRLNPQYRIMRQTGPVRISAETGWEAPDPAFWVPHGFALVNLDVRGAGRSDGVGSILSEQEGEDVHDVIEWVAAQPWCDGNVGMLGVSYLAISQYRTATTAPPHLRAIVPWEGFTDAYHDFFYPGGVPEIGFSRLWTTGLRRLTRMEPDLGAEARGHPDDAPFWRALHPDLARIEVPMLVCGSFSDHNLHSRGSMRAFRGVSSEHRHLYTHRDGKWAVFYSDEAKAAQLAFLERHLKGAERDIPRVRLEVRERGDRIVEVREEADWPLPHAEERVLWLGPDGRLSADSPQTRGGLELNPRRFAATFRWTFDEDTEITGDAMLRLWMRAHPAGDAHVFAGISKWVDGRFVPFEGSYGFGRDLVATGWRRVALNPAGSTQVGVEFGPSATLFRTGEELRLHISGRQLSPRNPLTGAAPGLYRTTPRALWLLEWGPERKPGLLLPVV
ncbi:MAG TPA: CocE/NonD family hydrolase [Microbacterium sp.]|nr:CocE/NonD family hydrolase [Microbacterium sp.]